MYASAWVITKTSDVDGNTRTRPELGERSSSVDMETLTL
jgi:betaine lipid synthase